MVLWILNGYTYRNQKWSLVTPDTTDEYDALHLFNLSRKDRYDVYITHKIGDGHWRAEDEIDNVYLLFACPIVENEVLDLTVE